MIIYKRGYSIIFASGPVTPVLRDWWLRALPGGAVVSSPPQRPATSLAAAGYLSTAGSGAAFLAYVEHVLAPSLKPGDIVAMGNLPAHRGAAVRHAIQAAGAELRFLPPWAPDLNPIEMALSRFKACLERRAARTLGEHETPSPRPSTSTPQTSAKTTSPLPGMTENDRKSLYPLKTAPLPCHAAPCLA